MLGRDRAYETGVYAVAFGCRLNGLSFHGGSYPPLQYGLQRHTRHTPRIDPDTAPCFCTAWMKYSLHDGTNRHCAPAMLCSSGLMQY
jgi:hypothetical protein